MASRVLGWGLWALPLASLALPFALRRRGFDARRTLLATSSAFALLALGGMLLPWLGLRALAIVLAAQCLAALAVVRYEVRLPPRERLAKLGRFGLLLGPPLLLLGGGEWFAWLATESRWLTLQTPIKTMYLGPEGTPVELADWRVYHMNRDDTKEPDPVLLWRPVPKAPFNEQRFQGPEVSVPKPAGVYRVFVYGDSNTAMPGAWPMHLRRFLKPTAAHRYEVVNAGVEGYTTYQGLMRYREERDKYQPDMILVSFGWNDAAPAADRPDKEYLPSPVAAAALRVAMRFRSYRLLVAAIRPKPAAHPKLAGSRVDRKDYEANLRAFVEESRRRGVSVVLLTRPHRVPPLEGAQDWVLDVPRYDQVVLDVAHATNVRALDSNALVEGDQYLFLPGDDCHLTETGHEVLGRRICERLFPVACPASASKDAALETKEPAPSRPDVKLHTTATGCAECELNQLYVSAKAVDGAISTEWLAPNGKPAELDLKLEPRTKIESFSLLNARNLPYADRGTIEFRYEVRDGDLVVAAGKAGFKPDAELPQWLTLPVGAEANRIHLTITNWYKLGGGIAEVRVH